MSVVTTSKYSKQNTIILKKRNTLFLLMKRKLSKRGGKKKESPVKIDPDEMYDLFLFWRGDGRKRTEERKQKRQPQDNKLCAKQKIIPFEGHFL